MNESILLIEDNSNHSRALKDMLIDEGYGVEIAKDGDEVKQKMAEIKVDSKLYDLLLIDIAVPKFKAIEFIETYKKTHRVIVVSAYADTDKVIRVIDEKWRIKKPFDANVLVDRIKERLAL
ncbi:MAG: response regulator [Candidatus Omnitrophota bacterium]